VLFLFGKLDTFVKETRQGSLGVFWVKSCNNSELVTPLYFLLAITSHIQKHLLYF